MIWVLFQIYLHTMSCNEYVCLGHYNNVSLLCRYLRESDSVWGEQGDQGQEDPALELCRGVTLQWKVQHQAALELSGQRLLCCQPLLQVQKGNFRENWIPGFIGLTGINLESKQWWEEQTSVRLLLRQVSQKFDWISLQSSFFSIFRSRAGALAGDESEAGAGGGQVA